MSSSNYTSTHHRNATVSPKLCKHCELMVLHQADSIHDRGQSVIYLEDLNATLELLSRTEACTICKYVWSIFTTKMPALSHSSLESTIIRHAVSTTTLDALSEGSLQYDIVYPATPKKRVVRIVLEVVLESKAPDNCLWRQHDTASSTERLRSAGSWLQVCQHDHQICQDWSNKYQRSCPTRLIHITGTSARLVCPVKGSYVPYAALSHCWGTGQPLKTTKLSLQDHMVEIPLLRLPQTFRDAIAIAQELTLAYIWIDSLCIIQDDSADWEREAANMANIYESAELTIAAAWGPDGSTGCFHNYIPPLLVQVSDMNENPDTSVRFAIRPSIDEGLFLNKAPLNTRQWVLQERLLSLRTLSFAQDQMYWACPSLTDSEDGLATARFSTENSNYKSLHYWESGAGEDVDSYLQLHESWELVVADHSSRKLTFARDKLATLAGVSQAYQRIFQDEPLLGLWKGDLARTLLWETEVAIHSQLDTEAIQTLHIPSWSWLKIDGKARATSHYGNGPLLTIDETVLTWHGLPMTSKISEAKIFGHGKLLGISGVGQPDGETCMCHANSIKLESEGGRIQDLALYTWYFDQCVEKLPDRISCLLVYDSKVPTRWTLPDDPFMEVRCLILQKAEGGRQSTEYERLGVIMVKEFPRQLYEAARGRDFVLL